jgi:hypothetical protein
LLFLTENYAALDVLKHFIHDLHPIEETKSFQTRESIHITSSTELDPWELEPFVLFGSSFPRDTEYTQVCRNINQIKICMETGRMVVLLNLHNLYESLYDLLNQYYIHYGEERYVDLGLQTHRLKCKVHKQFKLIMIAEKATVYEKFPTPLINRLEKHFVLMSSILSAQEKDILSRLDSWITQFSKVKSSTFQRKDAFVGYRDDTPAAVVFQANHLLHKLIQGKKKKSLEWIRFDDAAVFDAEILSGITSSHEKMHSEKWISAVLQLCKYILLYTCSPAALVRLAETPLLADFSHLCYMYKKQHHSSISDFLKYHIELCWNTQSMDGLLMQITTHSHLLSTNEVDRVEKILEYENGSIASFLLHDFDTELHFSSRVGPLFKSNRGKYCRLIILQCDMGCVTDNLIACARHRIYDMRANVKREMKDNEVVIGTHVLFIIHLPVQTVQSSLVGFQGDPWISAHIDEIRPTLEGNLTLDIAQGVPISQLFYGPFDDPTLVQTVDEQQLQTRAKEEVTFSSVARTTQKLGFESGPTHQEISSVTCPYEQIVTHEPNLSDQRFAPEACPMKQILHETSDQVCSQEHGPTKQIIASVAGPVTQALPNSSTHIDEIRPTLEGNLTLDIAQGVPISQLFYGPFDDPTLVQTVDEQQLQTRAKEEVTFSSVARTTQKLGFESGPTHQEISSVTCPYEQIVTHEPNLSDQRFAPEACPMKQILHETSDQVCSQEHGPTKQIIASVAGPVTQALPNSSTHIDEIRPTKLEGNLTLDIAQGVPISQLFYGPFDDPTLVQTVDEQQLQTRAKEEVTFSSVAHTTQKLGVESGPTHQEISSVTCPYEQIVTHEPNLSDQRFAPEACPMKQILHETSDQVCSQEHGPTKQIIASVAGPVTQALPNSSTQAVNIVQRRFVPPLYTQCRRLHICIQAAASKLIQFTPNKRWATQRIEILIQLIPDEPAFPLDTTSFYGIIVKYIHILLKERDDTYHLASNWVLEEAMNTRKLHIGGTFKNALAKKIDNIIIPLFAEVIATIDRNQNLHHLRDLGKKQCIIHDLWLHIFSTPEVFNLSYVEIAGREKAPVKDDFRCTFPFSWLIREAVDNQLESVKGYSGPFEDKYQQLCFTFSETLIGRLLNDFEVVNEETGEYLVQNYVVDFLHMSYKGVHFHPSEKEMECKLLQKVVFNLSKKSALLSAHVAWNNGQALSQRIVAVHIVYHSIEEEIHWFGQLTLCMPGVLQHLDTVTLESTEMELHLQALQRVLEILKPQPVKTEAVVKQWLTHVTRCHNAIDSILVVSPDHFLARQARGDWQRIQVLQMFVQHVVLKYDGMRQYANRLQLHMKKGADFSKLETMKRLRVFLKAVNNELRDLYKTKESKKIYHAIMKSCDDFFMEVVSTLCFGQATVPDGDLIEMLLNLIFTAATSADGATTSTKQLTSHKQRTDEVPVIRSFLLQLLLGQNSELLQEYLQMFFDKSVQALGYEHNRDLLLMCSQCYEDGLVKRYSSVTWEDQLLPCITFLNSGLHKLRTGENELSLKYLEMIASLRYALGVVAEILHRHCFIAQQMPEEDSSNGESQYDKDVSEECLSAVPTIVSPQTDVNAKESDMDCKVDLDDTKVAPITEREAVVQLLHTAKSICTISSTSGPLLYLLKQIVRRFGFTLFRKIVKFHPWLVPKTLFWAGEVSNTLDEFVIYGEEYIDIRESTNALAMSGQLHQLPLTQNEEQCSALLLLSLFRLVRKKQKLDHKSLTSVIQKSKGLTEEMKTMAKQILNEQEGPLVSIVKTHPFLAQNVSSLSVIIHSVAALLCRQKVDMLLPFKTMLYHPTSLAVRVLYFF